MSDVKLYLTCFLLSGLAYSCTPYLYAPNTLNMPLAKNVCESKVKAYISTSDYGFQGSYAVDSHIVVVSDGSFYKFANRYGNDSRTLLNIGAGYFHTIAKNGCFEILGGIGNGNSIGQNVDQGFLSFNPEQISSLKGNYQRVF